MTPKLIMQTWKTLELPEKWKPSQLSIKKYMSSWDYKLMTDEDNREFISTHFPDFLETYDTFPHNIQRADAIRYAWLYMNGGLYIDCDFELLGPLDELFDDDDELYFLASSNFSTIITNAFIAAKPGNPVFLEMIEEMKKRPLFSAIEKHLLVMYTTGPVAFNRVITRLNPKYKKLPNVKLNPYTLCDKIYNKPGTLLKPLEGSSWVSGFGHVWKLCYCNSIGIFVILLILAFALMLLF